MKDRLIGEFSVWPVSQEAAVRRCLAGQGHEDNQSVLKRMKVVMGNVAVEIEIDAEDDRSHDKQAA